MKVTSYSALFLSVLLLSSCAQLKEAPMSLASPTLPSTPTTINTPIPHWVFLPKTYIPRSNQILNGQTFTVVQYFAPHRAPKDFMYLITNTETHQRYGIVIQAKDISSATFTPQKDEKDWYLGTPNKELKKVLKNLSIQNGNCT